MNHTHSDSDEHVPHILPLKVYFGVAFALFFLTVLTVATAKIGDITGFNPGQPWNIIIALIIATTKVSLVALFFMHIKYDHPFIAVLFLSGFVFLGVFFLFTIADTGTRLDEERPSNILILKPHEDYTSEGYKKEGIKYPREIETPSTENTSDAQETSDTPNSEQTKPPVEETQEESTNS